MANYKHKYIIYSLHLNIYVTWNSYLILFIEHTSNIPRKILYITHISKKWITCILKKKCSISIKMLESNSVMSYILIFNEFSILFIMWHFIMSSMCDLLSYECLYLCIYLLSQYVWISFCTWYSGTLSHHGEIVFYM